MKTTHMAAALLSALALGATAFATETINLEFGPAYGGQNPWQAGGGGEFTAFASTGIPSGYSSDAILTLGGQTGFETFCIQPNVDASNQTTYNFQVSPDIWIPTYNGGGYTTQPVAQGAAWLYQQFATGSLAGYDYADSDMGNSRLNDASALQQAIWYFQGETYQPSADSFVDLALAHFGSSDAAMSAESPNQFGVNVINMYSADSTGAPMTLAQNTLIYTAPPVTPSVPDSASTFLLFGGVLALLGFAPRLQRRQRRLGLA